MLPNELLFATESRAPGICVYGKPGMKKTHSIYTLPPPILFLDWEGGSGSVQPWIHRKRRSNESKWSVYSQQEREDSLYLVRPELRDTLIRKPAPLIDLISFDNMRFGSWDESVAILGTFNPANYNSVALDPLKEFAFGTQTYSKGAGNEQAVMELKLWGGAQERAAIALRLLRSYREKGVVIYLVGTELIDKDYVTDPRSKERGGSPETPYSISATVDLPGKLVGVVEHLTDITLHARPLNGQPTWVSKPEPLPAGNCNWVAKDRFGRLPDFNPPNFHAMFGAIYGKAVRDKLYASSSNGSAAAAQSVPPEH